jgi:hypothetical protein
MLRTHEAQIGAFRATLDPNALATVDALRSLIMAIDQPLVEEFKWNAPSFRLEDEHRVTLGIERDGSVRMVLHRGVSQKDTQDFEFRDPLKLAHWPAKDRGVLKFRSLQDVTSQRDVLKSLVSRWLEILA